MEFTFLICSERSGSNLITRIMDSHPLYCGPSPIHLLRLILDNKMKYGNITEDKNWRELLRDVAKIFDSKTGIWASKMDFDFLYQNIPDRNFTSLYRFVFEVEAKANGKEKLFIKENHLHQYLPFLLSAFPNAKFVFLVRDPRDMALSWKLSPNLRGCVLRASDVWQKDQSQAIQLYQWLEEFNKIHLVYYEDLVAKTETILTKLCDFLSISYSEQMGEFQKNKLTTQNAKQSLDWENIQKPIMKKNYNKFKKGLLIEEIKYIEALSKEEMDLLGYKRTGPLNEKIEDLYNKLEPLELFDKPGYQTVPAAEKAQRSKRYKVEKSIKGKKTVSLV